MKKWYHMVPYKPPPPTMICPLIHDRRRPLSATRLRKKRDVVCHLRGFNVLISFSWILQEGCLKMLSASANYFCFLLLQNMQKWVCRLDGLLSLRLSGSSQFCVWVSVPRAHFFYPSQSKFMFLYCCLMLWTSENETPLNHNASFGLIFGCGSRSPNYCRECQKIGHLSVKMQVLV